MVAYLPERFHFFYEISLVCEGPRAVFNGFSSSPTYLLVEYVRRNTLHHDHIEPIEAKRLAAATSLSLSGRTGEREYHWFSTIVCPFSSRLFISNVGLLVIQEPSWLERLFIFLLVHKLLFLVSSSIPSDPRCLPELHKSR